MFDGKTTCLLLAKPPFMLIKPSNTMQYLYAPCMVYLPTELGDFVRANAGVHIPAPWSIWDIGLNYQCLLRVLMVNLIKRWAFSNLVGGFNPLKNISQLG